MHPVIAISDTGLLVLAIVVIVLFGASALPKFARSLGSASKEFKKGQAEGRSENPDEEKVTMTRSELDALLKKQDQTPDSRSDS